MCRIEKNEFSKKKKRKKTFRTSLSEVMTILLLFHRSNYRTFKHFYLNYVKINLKYLFPNLIGYPRFIQLTSEAFFLFFVSLKKTKVYVKEYYL